MKLPVLALVTAAPLTALSLGGDRVDAVVDPGNTRQLVVIEVDAGGVDQVERVSLQSLTPFQVEFVLSVDRIGDEVWVGTIEGLLRYGGAPLAYIDRAFADKRIQSITATPFGAILSTNEPLGVREVIETDHSAAVIRRVDTTPISFDDLEPYHGGFLGTVDSVVLELDANYGVVAEFAPDAFAIAEQNGFDYFPERVTTLSDGRIAIAGLASVAITENDGTVESVANPGPFERDVIESGGGLLIVPTASGLTLLDAATLESFPQFDAGTPIPFGVWGGRYSTTERGASGRTCTPSVNSTGDSARVHVLASPSAAERRLSLVATALPPGAFALPIHGLAAFDGVFGDGRLCVSPFVPGLTRGPVAAASALGSLQTDFDFVTPGLGAGFVAGTTWFHQVLFRDSGPAGTNGTDALFVTFEP
ncbi:MAG: hypothetical protein AAGB93_14245 [Planctomycetota bacterium]